MKPFAEFGRPTRWRKDTVHDGSAASMYLPNYGSGIAAKQYDPGAPFFLAATSLASPEAPRC
jgi:hypothetical protein